jgi:hypothetical protein
VLVLEELNELALLENKLLDDELEDLLELRLELELLELDIAAAELTTGGGEVPPPPPLPPPHAVRNTIRGMLRS